MTTETKLTVRPVAKDRRMSDIRSTPNSTQARAEKVRILFFTGEGCAPCAAMKKSGAIAKIGREFNIPVIEVDWEADEKWHDAYGISAVPTFCLEVKNLGVIAEEYDPQGLRKAVNQMVKALKAGVVPALSTDAPEYKAGPKLWARFPTPPPF